MKFNDINRMGIQEAAAEMEKINFLLRSAKELTITEDGADSWSRDRGQKVDVEDAANKTILTNKEIEELEKRLEELRIRLQMLKKNQAREFDTKAERATRDRERSKVREMDR